MGTATPTRASAAHDAVVDALRAYLDVYSARVRSGAPVTWSGRLSIEPKFTRDGGHVADWTAFTAHVIEHAPDAVDQAPRVRTSEIRRLVGTPDKPAPGVVFVPDGQLAVVRMRPTWQLDPAQVTS